MLVIGELNSDLHEGLKLIWKNACKALWHYLKNFKSYGEFIFGDDFLVPQCTWNRVGNWCIFPVSFVSKWWFVYLFAPGVGCETGSLGTTQSINTPYINVRVTCSSIWIGGIETVWAQKLAT